MVEPPQRSPELSSRAFLEQAEARLREALADSEPPPRIRKRWSMVQVSFEIPAIHYEVWLQRQRQRVEVGLHLEASADLNGWLMRRLGPDMPAVVGELGPGFELEQWTRSWGRIHTHLPAARVDAALAEQSADCLLRTVHCLQPRVSALLGQRGGSR